MIKVVSFFTPDYVDHALRLAESCERLGLRYDIQIRPPKGNWLLNCAMKPEFILKQVEASHFQPILWVDADAEILSDLRPLVGVPYQFGVHLFPRPERHGGPQVASGTIFLRPTRFVEHILKRWVDIANHRPVLPDQETLQKILFSDEFRGDERIGFLDPEWCFIYDLSAQMFPGVQPKIRHHQASRRTRAREAGM